MAVTVHAFGPNGELSPGAALALAGLSGGGDGGGGDVSAADITDSTATGRAVLTAATQAAARSAIGAGTSNLAIGTTGTTAAAGNRAASTTAIGMVELATNTEATTGTDTVRAVTPAGVKAVVNALSIPDSPNDIGAAPAAAGVPPGGTTGQVLGKASAADRDTTWVDQIGGGVDFAPLIATSGLGIRLNVASGSASVSPGRLGFIWIPQGFDINQVAITCTTAVPGSTVRLVCYTPTSPTTATLTLDSGLIGGDTTGTKTVVLPAPVTLSAGLLLWGIVPVDETGTAWTGGSLPYPAPDRDGANVGHIAVVGDIGSPPASTVTLGSGWAGTAPYVRARRSI